MRDCVLEWLTEWTSEGAPDRSTVETGDLAWDECECGQLAINLLQAYPSESFPSPRGLSGPEGGARSDSNPCGPQFFVFLYEVTMLRCAPVASPSGEAPSAEAVTDAARISTEDAWAVRAALQCCFSDLSRRRPGQPRVIERYMMDTQTFIGSQGMCQGSSMQVAVAIHNGCYPCDEDS